MVRAQPGSAVEERGCAFGREAVFVRVAADAADAFEGEVERRRGEAGAGEEGDQEGAEAAVDVQGEGSAERKPRECRDVVDDAVRERRRGPDEQDRVAVDEPGHAGDVGAVRGGRAADQMNFNAEVAAGFEEGGVCGFRDDPERVWISDDVLEIRMGSATVHFWLRDASLLEGLLPRAPAGHQD